MIAPDLTARELKRARAWIRRVLTDPITGIAIDIDPRRRLFDGTLRRFITIRDRHDRFPYSTAPIRHIDHIHPYRNGGPTTADNGQGVSQRYNHVKDLPGWKTKRIGTTGEIIIHTPTGHQYRSTPPPQLGYPKTTVAVTERVDMDRKIKPIRDIGRLAD